MSEKNQEGTGPTPCTDFCSLPPEQLRRRADQIRTELVPRIVSQHEVAGGFRWELPNGPETQRQLEEFVEFERRCCGGLVFSIDTSGDGTRLCLTVTGNGAEAMGALARLDG